MNKYQGLSVCASYPEKKGQEDQSKGCGSIYKNNEYAILAVSAGGKQEQYFRSHLGACFAAEAASDALCTFASSVTKDILFTDEKSMPRLMRQLEGSVIIRWKERVWTHLETCPFQPEEIKTVRDHKYKENYEKGIDLEYAYRANVTAAIVAKDYCLIIQNGDSECIIIKNRSRSEKILKAPVLWNNEWGRSYSDSICNKTALRGFRYCCLDTAPDAIFLVADSRYPYFDEMKGYSANLEQIIHELMRKGAEWENGLKERLVCLCRTEKLEYLCMACAWPKDTWSKRLKIQARLAWELNRPFIKG